MRLPLPCGNARSNRSQRVMAIVSLCGQTDFARFALVQKPGERGAFHRTAVPNMGEVARRAGGGSAFDLIRCDRKSLQSTTSTSGMTDLFRRCYFVFVINSV